MVQTDLTQLTRECSSWKESLRNSRSELSSLRNKLQEVVSHPISKTALPQVEHYDNQFDIQLTNINHLKHAIKEHEKVAGIAMQHPQPGEILWQKHETLHDQYQRLEHTLSELKDEFNLFVTRLS
jgi:chaperonin cofactor prefoldin